MAARTSRPLRRRLAIRFAAIARWLHIYVSLLGLAAVLFFSVTGLTLNHPNWFPGEAGVRSESEGRLKPEWVRPRAGAADPLDGVARFEIVEYLRKTDGLHGEVSDFRADEAECMVSFRGPGFEADATIRRDSGAYKIARTSFGFVALLNDLHKGRDTGSAWSVVIDVSAVILGVISLTGLVLLFYLKLRRVRGLVVVFVGAILLGALYYLGVP